MRKLLWFIQWIPCYLFGHVGIDTESGYHVCDRCGLHGYWSYRETSGIPMWIEYSDAGILIALWEKIKPVSRISSDSDDLPF